MATAQRLLDMRRAASGIGQYTQPPHAIAEDELHRLGCIVRNGIGSDLDIADHERMMGIDFPDAGDAGKCICLSAQCAMGEPDRQGEFARQARHAVALEVRAVDALDEHAALERREGRAPAAHGPAVDWGPPLAPAGAGREAPPEALDPVAPQYLGDLISWYAIGARTRESQTHREMASGLSAPVGFKNATDGDTAVAINAIRSARQRHNCLGIDPDGRSSIVRPGGNPYGHIVLRGGAASPNYDTAHVALVEQALADARVAPNIVVDCSHANSFKKPELQPLVFKDCMHQIIEGNRSIVGLMLESNLVAGSQPIPEDKSKLIYGCSVTDPCIGWETTETPLRESAAAVGKALRNRK